MDHWRGPAQVVLLVIHTLIRLQGATEGESRIVFLDDFGGAHGKLTANMFPSIFMMFSAHIRVFMKMKQFFDKCLLYTSEQGPRVYTNVFRHVSTSRHPYWIDAAANKLTSFMDIYFPNQPTARKNVYKSLVTLLGFSSVEVSGRLDTGWLNFECIF